MTPEAIKKAVESFDEGVRRMVVDGDGEKMILRRTKKGGLSLFIKKSK